MPERCVGPHLERSGTTLTGASPPAVLGRLPVFLLPVLIACNGGPVSDDDGSDAGRLGAVEDYLERAGRFGFSGAVLVARNGRVLLDGAYGMDGCWSSEPVTPETVYYVASLTKPLTAAAVLLLAEEGRIDLRDSIGRHFPDAPPATSTVTLEQLLTQRSGLGRPEPEPDTGWSREGFLRAVLRAEPSAAPGEQYRYANANYALLAGIVERVSGRPYGNFLRDRIFQPLGMQHSGTVEDIGFGERHVIAHACAGALEQGNALLSHRRRADAHLLGAVGVVTTTRDLHRFVRGLETHELLPRAIVERMFVDSVGGYGYGFSIGGARYDPLVSHTGLLLPEGWNGQLRHYPEQGLTLVVLSGSHRDGPQGWTVARAVDRLLLGGEVTFPPPVRRDRVRPGGSDHAGSDTALDLAGRYVSGDGEVFEIVRKGGRPALLAHGQPAVNLVLGVGEDRTTSLAGALRGSRRLLEGLASDSVVRVARRLTDDPPSRWAPALRATADWLEDRFGAILDVELLHAVPAAFGENAAVAYARLRFPRDTITVRTYWVDGEFGGMNDAGAYRGASGALPVEPSALPMARRPGGGWTAHLLGAADPLVVRSRAAEDGCRELRLWRRGSGPTVVAREDRKGCGRDDTGLGGNGGRRPGAVGLTPHPSTSAEIRRRASSAESPSTSTTFRGEDPPDTIRT